MNVDSRHVCRVAAQQGEARGGGALKMPFGRFKGRPLPELPDHYVLWLLTLNDLRNPLLDAISEEADRRIAEARAGAVA